PVMPQRRSPRVWRRPLRAPAAEAAAATLAGATRARRTCRSAPSRRRWCTARCAGQPRRTALPRQLQLIAFSADHHLAAALQFAEQDGVDQRLLDLLVNEPGHRPRAERLVVAVFGQ